MLKNFKKSAVGPKIKIGVSYLSRVIISLCIFSVIILIALRYAFASYRGIAIGTNNAGRIQANILEARLSALKFIKKGQDEDKKKFEGRINSTNSIIEGVLADKDNLNSDFVDQVQSIKLLVGEYSAAFDKVAELKVQRNETVYNKLDKLGPGIEKVFKKMLLQAHEDKDLSGVYNISISIKSISKARLQVLKFLDTNLDSSIINADKEVQNLKMIFSENESSFSPQYRSNYLKALELVKEYQNSFILLEKIIKKRNMIMKDTLDIVGPKVASLTENIKLSNKKKQDQLGPFLSLTILITIVLLIGVALAANFFGNFVSKELILTADDLKTRISNTVKGVIESSSRIKRLNEGLKQSSDSLSEIAYDQKENSTETASAATETTETVKGVEQLAYKSNDSSEKIRDVTSKATDTMYSLVESMKDIQSSNDEIKELSKVMNRIQEKVKIIDEIVFETKLLSFNASVEAARAGEAGKGFSVVAEEISNLAKVSGTSASEISSIINESIKEVDRIINSNTSKVKSGREYVESSSDSLKNISVIAMDNLEDMSKILAGSKEQFIAVSDISKSIQSIDSNSNKISQLSTCTSNSVESLNREAQKLEDLLVGLKEVVGSEDSQTNPLELSEVTYENERIDDNYQTSKVS